MSIEASALKKASRRILPLFFVLYIVSYLDRANVTFAKLPMLADLGFSEAIFGLGAGMFFLGYFALGIPGAIVAERWSVRRLLTTILVAWGFFTVLVGFITTPLQFYAARFLLGFSEAAFFPVVIVYYTHWFPSRVRAHALSGLVLAVPVSFIIGAPLSAAFMSLHWFGLPGWRWIFILQGLPAILLGVLIPFCVSDRPQDAAWLEPEEREWLTQELSREAALKKQTGHVSIYDALTSRYVLLLATALCLIVVASYGYIFWLPTTIKSHSGLSTVQATLLSGIPFALAAITVRFAARSSDRRGERKLHTAIPLIVAGLSFAMITVPNQPFPLTMVWLCVTGMSLWAWSPSFWVLPTLTLGESAAAASIGFINSIGNLGGFAGPSIVGYIISGGWSFSVAVTFLCICFLIAAALILSLRISDPAQERQ